MIEKVPTMLGPDDLDQVVAVLAEAFHDYPVMRHTLGSSGDYAARLPVLIRLFVCGRALRGEPMLGLHSADGCLQAVALVTPPDTTPPPPALVELRTRTWATLGDDARLRYEQLVEAWTRCAPDGRRFHLNMLGVRPARRGEGLARALLEAVLDLASGDPSAKGLDLTTELASNLDLYRRFGFRIVAEDSIEGVLRTWTLVHDRR